jgi:hypothetical protein
LIERPIHVSFAKEWEHAARGGLDPSNLFPWGSELLTSNGTHKCSKEKRCSEHFHLKGLYRYMARPVPSGEHERGSLSFYLSCEVRSLCFPFDILKHTTVDTSFQMLLDCTIQSETVEERHSKREQ